MSVSLLIAEPDRPFQMLLQFFAAEGFSVQPVNNSESLEDRLRDDPPAVAETLSGEVLGCVARAHGCAHASHGADDPIAGVRCCLGNVFKAGRPVRHRRSDCHATGTWCRQVEG